MSEWKRFGLIGVAAGLLALIVTIMAGQGTVLAAAPCQGGSPTDWRSWGGGSWTCNGSTTMGHSSTGDSLLLSQAWMSDFDFSADVGTYNREATLAFRFQDPNNGYLLVFMPDGLPGYASGIWLVRRIGGLESFIFYNHPYAFPTAGNSGNLRVVAVGAYLQIYFNGVLIGSVTDGTFASGMAGYRIYGDGISDDAWFANGALSGTGAGYQTSAYPAAGYPAGYQSNNCNQGLTYNVATHQYEYPYGCNPSSLFGGCNFFAYTPAGLYNGYGAYGYGNGYNNGYNGVYPGQGCLIGQNDCDDYGQGNNGYGNGNGHGGYGDAGYGGGNGGNGGYGNGGYGNGYGNFGCFGNGGNNGHDCGNNGFWDQGNNSCHGNGGNNDHNCGGGQAWDESNHSCHNNCGGGSSWDESSHSCHGNCGGGSFWDSGSNSCHGNGGNNDHNCGGGQTWDTKSNSCHGNGGNNDHNCGNNSSWDAKTNSCHSNH